MIHTGDRSRFLHTMKPQITTALLAAGLIFFAPRANAEDRHHSYHHYNSHGSYYGHNNGYSGYGYSGRDYSGHDDRGYDRVYSHGYSGYDGRGYKNGHSSRHRHHQGITIRLFGF